MFADEGLSVYICIIREHLVIPMDQAFRILSLDILSKLYQIPKIQSLVSTFNIRAPNEHWTCDAAHFLFTCRNF